MGSTMEFIVVMDVLASSKDLLEGTLSTLVSVRITIFSYFSVAKATLDLVLSVRASVCSYFSLQLWLTQDFSFCFSF